jgi:hypothetical protein
MARRTRRTKAASDDAVVGAALVAALRRTSEGETEPPSWFAELIEALSPLKSLAQSHGALSKTDAARLKDLQNVLQRADLSKAVRPPPSSYDQTARGKRS